MKRSRVILLTVVIALFMMTFVSSAEQVTISVLSHYTSGLPHGKALYEYAEEYERLNPNVKVEMQFIANNLLLDRLLVGAASGTLPDVVHIAGFMLGDVAESGIIAPLPESVLNQVEPVYLPGALELAEYDGQVWGYPTEFMPRALVYNRNLFDRVGLASDPPETWADLREYSAKLTDTNPDGSFNVAGFGLGLSDSGQHGFGMVYSMGHPMGARLLSEDGRSAALNSPEVTETLDYLRELVSSGYAVANTWLVIDMKASEIAMMVAPGPYWKTEFQQVSDDFYAGMGTSVIPVPEQGMTPAAAAYGWLFSVTNTTEHPDEVYDFLNWLNTQPLPDGRTRMGNVLAHLGSIPVTADDLRYQDTVRDPFMAGFVEAVANNWTFADPVAPNTPAIYRSMETALRTAVLGIDSPRNALIQAEREIQNYLDAAYR